uniref:Post-GPI attachment to proteins 6 n=2 Tax=Taeniopygia guttata TaxID=59729 RepID=A0A674H3I2_TAEGU
MKPPVCFCGWIKPCSLPPAALLPTAVLSPFQTPSMSPSTSLRVHRSSPSTAGMGTPSSSTSTCQRTPCCCAGSCRHPGGRAPSAPAWRSLCTFGTEPLPSLTLWALAFLPTPPSVLLQHQHHPEQCRAEHHLREHHHPRCWGLVHRCPPARGCGQDRGEGSSFPQARGGGCVPAEQLRHQRAESLQRAGAAGLPSPCPSPSKKEPHLRPAAPTAAWPWSRPLGEVAAGHGGESRPANASVSVEMLASFTVCRPGSSSSFLNFISLNQSQAGARPGAAGSSAPAAGEAPGNMSGQRSSCLQSQPVVREDLDVVSVRYRLLNGPSVPVTSLSPTLLLLNLNTGMDSGGSLVVSLLLNKTSVSLANATVAACVSAASPVLSLNATQNCSTAFSQGYPLSVSTSSAEAMLIVLYPQTDDWFLSLQLLCPKGQGECAGAEGRVAVLAYSRPASTTAGPTGSAASCAGTATSTLAAAARLLGGWSCTDDTKAQSVGTQNLATLLLTLSNLMFLPAIAVAVYRFYLVEASVYTYTMFFSTFYHACDQPGVAVMCIMDYDTLQYCDFLGSVVSIWVTPVHGPPEEDPEIRPFCLGTLLIAMSCSWTAEGCGT